MIYVQDPDFTLHVGDVRDVLRELPDESVDCVVTSPPYWGLRDYGTGEWEGGDAECDHLAPLGGGFKSSTLHEYDNGLTAESAETIVKDRRKQFAGSCGKCGATRIDRQLGLEPTPEEYVANMVEVFREVRRVLAKHGTCWVNLGDSYATTSWNGTRGHGGSANMGHTAGNWGGTAGFQEGVKPKDLVGIPWRVAFALQADGWYLRSDIIWAKPNPMPESVTDRPTKAHEYVFLLTKSSRYFFDQEAVREPHEYLDRRTLNGKARLVYNGKGGDGTRNDLDADWKGQHPAGRNIRSVWEIPTQPYPEAHFATYPEALVERCLKAGCAEGRTVLDPFLGSGTTALVARRLGRHAIGIELNPGYAELAAKRLSQLSLLAEGAA